MQVMFTVMFLLFCSTSSLSRIISSSPSPPPIHDQLNKHTPWTAICFTVHNIFAVASSRKNLKLYHTHNSLFVFFVHWGRIKKFEHLQGAKLSYSNSHEFIPTIDCIQWNAKENSPSQKHSLNSLSRNELFKFDLGRVVPKVFSVWHLSEIL